MKNFLFIFLTYTFLIFLSINSSYAQSNFDLLFGNSKKYQDVSVKKIYSADTILLDNDEKIKLIGLNAPEPPERDTHIERNEYGIRIPKTPTPEDSINTKAFDYVRELLEGKKVRLEFDSEKNDPDFQTLAYVFLKENNLFVNADILEKGFAQLRIGPLNRKYAKQLRTAYKQARQEKRGLHIEE